MLVPRWRRTAPTAESRAAPMPNNRNRHERRDRTSAMPRTRSSARRPGRQLPWRHKHSRGSAGTGAILVRLEVPRAPALSRPVAGRRQVLRIGARRRSTIRLLCGLVVPPANDSGRASLAAHLGLRCGSPVHPDRPPRLGLRSRPAADPAPTSCVTGVSGRARYGRGVAGGRGSGLRDSVHSSAVPDE